MSEVDTCAMADLSPAFSLGALDGADLLRFESHLLDGCGACARELAQADRVAGLLGEAAEPVSPPAWMRGRVMLEISAGDGAERDGRIDPVLAPGSWEPHHVPGVTRRVLRVEPAAREVLMLVRAAPGVRYPAHRHAGSEELLMLSGELEIDGRVYGSGDFLLSAPRSTHPPSLTVGGCMFLIRTSLDDEIVR